MFVNIVKQKSYGMKGCLKYRLDEQFDRLGRNFTVFTQIHVWQVNRSCFFFEMFSVDSHFIKSNDIYYYSNKNILGD